jgi:hypothetical protein
MRPTLQDLSDSIGVEIVKKFHPAWHVELQRAEYDPDLFVYRFTFSLDNDRYYSVKLSDSAVSLPIAPEYAQLLTREERQKNAESWVQFRGSIRHFVDEICYTIERVVYLDKLREKAKRLSDNKIRLLRLVREEHAIDVATLDDRGIYQDSGFLDFERWKSLLGTNENWSDLFELAKSDLLIVNDSITLGVVVRLSNDGYRILEIIDQDKK